MTAEGTYFKKKFSWMYYRARTSTQHKLSRIESLQTCIYEVFNVFPTLRRTKHFEPLPDDHGPMEPLPRLWPPPATFQLQHPEDQSLWQPQSVRSCHLCHS